MLKAYPNFSEGYLYIIDAQLKLNQDVSKRLKNFNPSLLHSKIYSKDEKTQLEEELKTMLKQTALKFSLVVCAYKSKYYIKQIPLA